MGTEKDSEKEFSKAPLKPIAPKKSMKNSTDPCSRQRHAARQACQKDWEHHCKDGDDFSCLGDRWDDLSETCQQPLGVYFLCNATNGELSPEDIKEIMSAVMPAVCFLFTCCLALCCLSCVGCYLCGRSHAASSAAPSRQSPAPPPPYQPFHQASRFQNGYVPLPEGNV